MKYIHSFLALIVLLMASCSKDESILSDDSTEAPVRFSLNTSPMVENNPSTRSTDTLTVDYSDIDNLWIFQFVDGIFQKKLYIEPSDLSNFEVNLIAKGTSDLYFMANVGPTAFAANFAPASASALRAIVETEATCLFPSSGRMLIPMRGCVKNVTPNKNIMQVLQVKMFRLLARIDYTYSVSAALISSKGFTVNKIRLRNINANVGCDSVTTDVYPVYTDLRTQTFSYETGVSNATRTLTFFVPDNRRGKGTNTALIDPRLKTGVDGATFIEMVGTTSSGDEYTYSLYPGSDAYNDYNICANTHYHITANLMGVSDNDARIKKTVVETVTSNCYILAPGGTVSIPVIRANKSALGTQLPSVTSGWSASIYWQTAAGLITVNNADKSGGCFTVTAPSGSATGNAVVAVKNASGDIVWSWHIWVTGYNPAAENETMNGNVWMSRNLGATALADGTAATFATCGGLLYQWGRKDPFPGSDGVNITSPYTALPIYDATGTQMTNGSLTWPTDGTPTASTTSGDVVKSATLGTTPTAQIPYASQFAYSVKYPLLYLANWAGSTAKAAAAHTIVGGMSSWGGEYGEGKSLYDPCPLGWRVPSGRKASNTFVSPWSSWTTIQTFTTSTFAALKWSVSGVKGSYYYPAIGLRFIVGGGLFNVCSDAYYWGASSSAEFGYSMNFNSLDLGLVNSSSRSFGFGVRCVKE